MDFRVTVFYLLFGLGIASCSHTFRREFHLVKQRMTWSDAQRYCREKYTDLAIFRSLDDMKGLDGANMDIPYTWIGLHDDPKSWKKTLGGDVNSWKWSRTGTTNPTGYHNWGSGEPNNQYAREGCAQMSPYGTWNDSDCLARLYSVCYNVSKSGGKRYHVVAEAMTWAEAQAHCRSRYKDLAMIENQQENTAAWLERSAYVWIGLYRDPWSWSDGTSCSFKNWGPGNPENYGGDQHCIAITPDGKWEDVRCNEVYPFFCHKDVREKTRVRMKIQSDADLSASTANIQILQQLTALMKNKMHLTNLTWAVAPRRQKPEEEEDEEDEVQQEEKEVC